MDNIKIFDLNIDLTERAAEIEAACLSVAWSAASISGYLNSDTAVYILAFDGDKAVGIAGMNTVVDECQINNIAVLEEYRRHGIGVLLLDTLLERAVEKNCLKAFLEVAANNTAALALYRSRGFENIGLRRGYYKNPLTDAYIMAAELTEQTK